jgi:hypothetical protein
MTKPKIPAAKASRGMKPTYCKASDELALAPKLVTVVYVKLVLVEVAVDV